MQLANNFNCEMKDYMSCNIEEYKNHVEIKDGKKIWTKAFCVAFEKFNTVVIPKGKYYIDASVVIADNKRIIADENAEIILLKNTRVLMLRNNDVIDGSKRKISKLKKRTNNIFIQGGIWGCEDERRYNYGKEGVFDA